MDTRTEITLEDFLRRLDAGDSDFTNLIFDFTVVLSGNIDQDLNFRNSKFRKSFSVIHTSFNGEVRFNEVEFHENTNFSHARFMHRCHFDNTTFLGSNEFKRTHFERMVDFNGSYFYGDAFFERTFFKREVVFVKTHFLRDVYFHKTYFGMRADFSYAAFADLYVTSFFSIQSNYRKMDGQNTDEVGPRLVFRYVFFPRKTMFTAVDLTRVILQNSMIENIIFKDCEFSQVESRAAFYPEIAKTTRMTVPGYKFDALESCQERMEYRLAVDRRRKLNIADRIEFIHESDPSRVLKTFITERHLAKDIPSLISKLEIIYPFHDFEREQKILEKKYTEQEIEEFGLVAFGLKIFNETKHWENLEDINRQMKKSLEDSKDWQGAGDFYRGEMQALINKMKSRKEKPVYRTALSIYGLVAGFCESTERIAIFMLMSLTVSTFVLSLFVPGLSIVQLIEYNLGFFIPLYGADAASLRSLALAPWQNIVVLLIKLWYYVLWFLLIITLQRKFKR